MILPRKYPCAGTRSKNTPGDRCNCDTITRSVPLMMKVPLSVISGISPKNTSCSLISRTLFFCVSIFGVHRQPDSHLERRCISHAALLALQHVVFQLQPHRVAAFVAERHHVLVKGAAVLA